MRYHGSQPKNRRVTLLHLHRLSTILIANRRLLGHVVAKPDSSATMLIVAGNVISKYKAKDVGTLVAVFFLF